MQRNCYFCFVTLWIVLHSVTISLRKFQSFILITISNFQRFSTYTSFTWNALKHFSSNSFLSQKASNYVFLHYLKMCTEYYLPERNRLPAHCSREIFILFLKSFKCKILYSYLSSSHFHHLLQFSSHDSWLCQFTFPIIKCRTCFLIILKELLIGKFSHNMYFFISALHHNTLE